MDEEDASVENQSNAIPVDFSGTIRASVLMGSVQ